jgi:hypothetical protein
MLFGLFLGSFEGFAVAENNPPANTAPDLYRSTYYLGRGNTGVAVADEEEAIFYNPAGLALGKGVYKKTVLASPQVEFSTATRDLIRKLTAENANAVEAVRGNIGVPNHLGIRNFTGIIFRRAALGAIASSNTDLLAYKSPTDGGLEAVRASTDQSLGLTFSLAESFWANHLYLGVTGKYLARSRGYLSASAAEADTVQAKIKDQSSFLGVGQGEGADVGLMYVPDSRVPWSLGLTVNDVGDTNIRPQKESSIDLDLKQTVNIGIAIEPGTRTSKLRLLVDYRDIASRVEKNPRKKLHMGAELTVANAIGITGGVNQGYPTAGFYLDLYLVRVDFALYTEETEATVGARPDSRYVMRIKTGF